MTEQIILYPDLDTMVEDWPYFTPYIIDYLTVAAPLDYHYTAENRTFMRYYIPPEIKADDIISAEMQIEAIWWNVWEDVPNTFSIRKTLENWSYGSITWFNQPACTESIYGTLFHAGNGPITSDVTQLVKEWIEGPNYGLRIMPPAERNNILTFWSSRGTIKPIITLTMMPTIAADFQPLEIIKIGPL